MRCLILATLVLFASTATASDSVRPIFTPFDEVETVVYTQAMGDMYLGGSTEYRAAFDEGDAWACALIFLEKQSSVYHLIVAQQRRGGLPLGMEVPPGVPEFDPLHHNDVTWPEWYALAKVAKMRSDGLLTVSDDELAAQLDSIEDVLLPAAMSLPPRIAARRSGG